MARPNYAEAIGYIRGQLDAQGPQLNRIEDALNKALPALTACNERLDAHDLELKQRREGQEGHDRRIRAAERRLYAIWIIGPLLAGGAAFFSDLKQVFGH